MKKIQVNIAVTCKFGVKFPVIDAFDLGKGLCLHRTFEDEGVWDKWTIGHVSSGWRVIGRFSKKANAIKVAEEILLKLNWEGRKNIIVHLEEHREAFFDAQKLRDSLEGIK